VVRQRKRHDVARVVVHEADEVEPLVLAQEKREDVALPELVGLGALEAARWVLAWATRRLRLNQLSFVQNAPYLGLAHAECLEACEHVVYPPGAVLGVLLPHLHHRFSLLVRAGAGSCRWT